MEFKDRIRVMLETLDSVTITFTPNNPVDSEVADLLGGIMTKLFRDLMVPELKEKLKQLEENL